MQKKVQPLLKQVTFKLLAVVVLFIGCLLLFARIADENVLEKNYAFDTRVAGWVASHTSPRLLQFMEALSFFGSTQFLFPAYIVLIIFLFWKKEKIFAIDAAIIAVSSTAVLFILKEVFKRERPSLPSVPVVVNFSFPSGHMVSSFIFFSLLIYYVWKLSWKIGWKWLLACFLLLFNLSIGASRIFLNVHYATDVIAGFCLGVLWVLMSFFVMEKIRKKIPAALPTQSKKQGE